MAAVAVGRRRQAGQDATAAEERFRMDADRFDGLVRSLSSRRTVVRLGALLGVKTALSAADLGARKRKKRRKRKTCRGAKISCGRACCALAGTNPDCCPAAKANVCTNLATDPANCGRCGLACGAGKVCAGGLCWDPCPEPSGCFSGEVRLCNGQNLCVSVDGVAVCAVGGNCFALTDCSADPGLCPAGSACADICCGAASGTCRTPA
jgi:hypothetical protein